MAKKRKTQSPNKRRKGLLAIILPWLKRFGVAVAIIIFVIWLGAWVILSGAGTKAVDWAQQSIISASAKAGFTVQDVLLEGRVNADANFIKALINVQAGDPLFGISPATAQALLEDTQWVRKATVARRLPQTLYIKLTERIPTALWQHNNELYLLDERGDIIKTDQLDRFAELIIISGEGAEKELNSFLRNLRAEPIIHERTKSAKRIGDRRWDITLDNNLTINLPEDPNIGFALKRAASAQQEDGLFDMKNIQSVDMRFEDKMILKTKPGAVQDYNKNNAEKREQGL